MAFLIGWEDEKGAGGIPGIRGLQESNQECFRPWFCAPQFAAWGPEATHTAEGKSFHLILVSMYSIVYGRMGFRNGRKMESMEDAITPFPDLR